MLIRRRQQDARNMPDAADRDIGQQPHHETADELYPAMCPNLQKPRRNKIKQKGEADGLGGAQKDGAAVQGFEPPPAPISEQPGEFWPMRSAARRRARSSISIEERNRRSAGESARKQGYSL